MAYRFDTRALLTALLLAAIPALPLSAQATGEAGEHVTEFERHMEEYAAEVRKLEGKLEAIAGRYSKGRDVKADIDELVELWESVKYHGAVEEVAQPLYPPIWKAIGGLYQAAKAEKPPEVFRERADAMAAALREGLGGLKLKARMAETNGARTPSGEGETGGPEAAFQRIRANLDRAVEAYENGNSDRARQLIHDAYFNRFEGLEGVLIEQDPDLVARLEKAFNIGLPGLIDQGAPAKRVRGRVKEMKEALARAEDLYRKGAGEEEKVF